MIEEGFSQLMINAIVMGVCFLPVLWWNTFQHYEVAAAYLSQRQLHAWMKYVQVIKVLVEKPHYVNMYNIYLEHIVII